MGSSHAALGCHTRLKVTNQRAEMVDVVFEVEGETLPAAYHYALWDELIRLVPQLGDDEDVGIVPLRIAQGDEGMLLPKRAKLVLRLPPGLVDIVSNLAQKQMLVSGCELWLGPCRTRPIQPYSTLHAQLVSGSEDEVVFVQEVKAALAALGVKAKLICGQHRTLADGEREISGFSLVLHDLTPEGSLLVQYAGLGKGRRFGCGVFMPYKVISGLE